MNPLKLLLASAVLAVVPALAKADVVQPNVQTIEYRHDRDDWRGHGYYRGYSRPYYYGRSYSPRFYGYGGYYRPYYRPYYPAYPYYSYPAPYYGPYGYYSTPYYYGPGYSFGFSYGW